MSKHTIYKVVLLALALSVFGQAWVTRARWSTTVVVKNNSIRTGTVALAVSPAEAWLSIDGLVPGQQIERFVSLHNSGTTALRVYLTAKKSAGYTTLFTGLRCTIIDQRGGQIYQGNLSDVNQVVLNPALDSGGEQEFTVKVELPNEAPAELSDSYVNASFELTAEQI